MAVQKHITPAVQLSLSLEEWRSVVGYEGLYEVSSLGRVRSHDRYVPTRYPGRQFLRSGRMMRVSGEKYKHVILWKDQKERVISVHLLVLEAFVAPRPDGMVCNHIDLDKHNNTLSNLEWVTPKRNSQHAIEKGVIQRGQRHWRAILTDEHVQEIRSLADSGVFQRTLARQFGVSQTTIWRIIHHEAWKHV